MRGFYEPRQQQFQLRERYAARLGRVDRRHHRRVEDVHVEVDPVARAVDELFAGPLGAAGGALGPEGRYGAGDDSGRLEVEAVFVLGPDAHHHHVDVAVVGAAALHRRQVGLAPAGHQGQVLAGGGADVRGVAGVAEVRVAVDEDQADAAADGLAEAVHREGRAEHDRAVAAEHDREFALVDDGADAVGQAAGVDGDLRCVADAVAGAPVAGVVPGRGEAAGVAGVEAAQQTLVAQGSRRLGAARHRRHGRRAQTEIGRCVEHGYAAHGAPRTFA
ncbi:hypothetical protein Asp14428_60030 [Actinoplanes sp. NBRC 14428]|nr:hypothetical protein Asp14428_60030 [Actinoplanes sp. NBRC 14428]